MAFASGVLTPHPTTGPFTPLVDRLSTMLVAAGWSVVKSGDFNNGMAYRTWTRSDTYNGVTGPLYVTAYYGITTNSSYINLIAHEGFDAVTNPDAPLISKGAVMYPYAAVTTDEVGYEKLFGANGGAISTYAGYSPQVNIGTVSADFEYWISVAGVDITLGLRNNTAFGFLHIGRMASFSGSPSTKSAHDWGCMGQYLAGANAAHTQHAGVTSATTINNGGALALVLTQLSRAERGSGAFIVDDLAVQYIDGSGFRGYFTGLKHAFVGNTPATGDTLTVGSTVYCVFRHNDYNQYGFLRDKAL